MKGQRVSVVLVGMLLSGCAGNMVWTKDGATPQQFNADQFDCKQKAYTMVGGYNSNNLGALVVNSPGFFNECMESKGYRLTTQDQANNQMVWYNPQKSVEENEREYRECDQYRGTQKTDCLESRGYRVYEKERAIKMVEKTFNYVQWYSVNMKDGEKVWSGGKGKALTDQLEDYRRCEVSQGTHRARTCMEALGYHRIYPSSIESVQMDKPGVTEEQGWKDKVACDAPIFADVKACLRTKGYVDRAVVQHAAK